MAEETKIKYTEVVSATMKAGKYYQDGMDWYGITYFSVLSEKTFFVLLSVFSLVVMFYLYATIKNILPLRERFPVYVMQKDSLNYVTKISPLKPKNISYTSSEAALRMLLIYYAKEMFIHNYKSGNIEDLNQKLSKIQLYSSKELFESFKTAFNDISGQMFNKNIEQRVAVTNFKLIRRKSSNRGKKITGYIKSYFSPKMPAEAELTCIIDVLAAGALKSRTEKKILFAFSYEPVTYSAIKNEFTKPQLIINGYKVLEEKNHETN
ncbi:MAG: hypothetical protein LBB09_03750 [Rickettsiales bacterium]|jgi:type IV secretory pathway component VirB8|nr:hypothetical protein [Rickettsiales bacterium]